MCIFTVNYANALCNVTPDLLVYMQHVTSIYTETPEMRPVAGGRVHVPAEGHLRHIQHSDCLQHRAPGLLSCPSPLKPASTSPTKLSWGLWRCIGPTVHPAAPSCAECLASACVSADLRLFFHSLFCLLFLTSGLGVGRNSGETESGFLSSLRVQGYQLNWLRVSMGLWFEVSVALLLLH